MADQTKYSQKLKNKRVLVIGGSSGIGYAVAEAALESGAHVTISSSNPLRLSRALAALQTAYPSAATGGRIAAHAADMGDEAALDDAVAALFAATGPLDHIVYTAGEPSKPTPLADATVAAIRAAATTRYVAPVLVAKHAAARLTPSPGSSVTLATGVVTQKPLPGWSVIAGARSAVLGLSKALALDLRPVRVNAVVVGAVDTDTWAHLEPAARERTFAALTSKSTTGRIAAAADVAEAFLYCMRDANVTGAEISTSSGVLLT